MDEGTVGGTDDGTDGSTDVDTVGGMDDTTMLRSARNAYLVVLVLLVGISAYQFTTIGGITDPIAAVWVAAAGAFYLSKWYYGRGDGG